ncbi:MAG: ABC transporter permease, partial [Planctomycetes bacterium]|nr:ABC transporter permease [Planctomycetota bacterium]
MTKRIAQIVLALWLVVGLFGPLLATELPLAVRIDGTWRFPAFAGLVGERPEPPANGTWSDWWRAVPFDSEDVVWLAPIPFDPSNSDEARLYAGPSTEHPFGNDRSGRDVLALIVHGASTALEVAVFVVLFAGAVGVALGAIAGLRGGLVDSLVLRLVELSLCFPVVVAVLCVAAFVGRSQSAVIVVLAAIYWTSFARIVRGEFLSLREREFVATARGLGIGTPRLVLRHMLPCVLGQVGVVAAFVAASAITVESTMRFLGLGASGVVSWGELIAQFRVATASAWHLWLFPGLAIFSVVVALHRVADVR